MSAKYFTRTEKMFPVTIKAYDPKEGTLVDATIEVDEKPAKGDAIITALEEAGYLAVSGQTPTYGEPRLVNYRMTRAYFYSHAEKQDSTGKWHSTSEPTSEPTKKGGKK